MGITFYFSAMVEAYFPDGNYMFKVNYRNTKARCEIYSKLIIKAP